MASRRLPQLEAIAGCDSRDSPHTPSGLGWADSS